MCSSPEVRQKPIENVRTWTRMGVKGVEKRSLTLGAPELHKKPGHRSNHESTTALLQSRRGGRGNTTENGSPYGQNGDCNQREETEAISLERAGVFPTLVWGTAQRK